MIKKPKIIVLLLFLLSLGCKSKETSRFILLKLTQQGYERALIEHFDYQPNPLSDEESQYVFREYYKKYKDSLTQPSFLTIPSIKDTLIVSVSFPSEVYRKHNDLTLDTIDVYINNKLWHSGVYPYKLQDRSRYPNLPTYGSFKFINKKKTCEASLTVVYRNDKIYFDTLIPLRFRALHISYNKYVSFFFQGPV